MKEAAKKVIAWVADFFDESKPQSFSRLITFVIVAFVLGWDTAYMYYTHTVIEATTFAGQIVTAATFYGVRRGFGAYEAKLEKDKEKE